MINLFMIYFGTNLFDKQVLLNLRYDLQIFLKPMFLGHEFRFFKLIYVTKMLIVAYSI